MKKTLLWVIVVLLSFPMWAGTQMQTEERNHTNFHALNVSSCIKVNLQQGNNYQVKITSTNLPEVISEVRHGKLYLYCSNHFNQNSDYKEVVVDITMPTLTELELAGASELTCKSTFLCQDVDMDCAGASDLSMQLKANELSMDFSGATNAHLKVEAQSIDLEASGASEIELSGKANTLIIDVSGASTVDARSCTAQDAEVEASGASTVKVKATEILSMEASGASSIHYFGSPTIHRIRTSGASSIRP